MESLNRFCGEDDRYVAGMADALRRESRDLSIVEKMFADPQGLGVLCYWGLSDSTDTRRLMTRTKDLMGIVESHGIMQRRLS